MTEKIFVTDAQVKAAKMIVDRDQALGRRTDEAIRKIAEAKPEVRPSSVTDDAGRPVGRDQAVDRETRQSIRNVPSAVPEVGRLGLVTGDEDRPVGRDEAVDRETKQSDWKGTAAVSTLKKGTRVTGVDRTKLATSLSRRYDSGESIRSLAASTGRSYGFIHRILTETGVTIRGRSGSSRFGKTKARH